MTENELEERVNLVQNKRKKFKNIVEKAMYFKREEINKIIDTLLREEKIHTNESSIKEAAKVTHPIKRTNVILKNPNFQIAAKLWDYLYNYTENINDEENDDKNKLIIDDVYKSIIDSNFLINYLIMKDACTTKKDETNEELMKTASLEMLKRSVELLMKCDSRITIEEII